MLIAIVRFVAVTVIGVFVIDAAMKLLKITKDIVMRKLRRNRNREALQTAR